MNSILKKTVETDAVIGAVPPEAGRDYIIDMLSELCLVAKQSGQDDLHVLLKLVAQAARDTV